MRTETVGATTEGRPFLLLTISAEKNLAPAGADPARPPAAGRPARPLHRPGRAPGGAAAHGRGATHGIHATEVAGAQTALETAWLLASTQDPALLKVLDETIVLLVPSQNPDGAQKVVEWYRRTLGTPFEGAGCESGCRLPFLYHHYVGHDNNRDWYAFTQRRRGWPWTRSTTAGTRRSLHDMHQMGTRGPRLFVPPYMDPWEPNMDPALRAGGTPWARPWPRRSRRGQEGRGHQRRSTTPGRRPAPTRSPTAACASSARRRGGRLASPMEVTADQLEPGPGVDPRRPRPELPRALAGRHVAPARPDGLPAGRLARPARLRAPNTGARCCARSTR